MPMAMLAGSVVVGSAPATATANEVLILGSSVTGGTSSTEALEVTAQGLDPVVVDDATWQSMTTAQFAAYRAIVIGDPTCQEEPPPAAVANATTWGPAISGNTIVIGTDPVYHGKTQFINQSIDFVLASSTGKTGGYLDLSCNYDNQPTSTDAVMLDGLRGPGAFTVHTASCYNDAHIVATHPAFAGLTDGYMSGWSCSVHEVLDTWPGDFQVLAIAKDLSSTYTASDGTVGAPYVLASGSGLHSYPLSLDPLSQNVPVDGSATVTAQLLDAATATPVAGKQLSFRVASGPGAGTHGLCLPAGCVTNAAGQVQFSYLGSGLGTDTVQTWIDSDGNGAPSSGEPQTTAAITWTRPTVSCTNAVFIAAIGSGETFQDPTTLSVSKPLAYLYKNMLATAGTKTVSPLVLNYPAASVDVLFNGLKNVTGNAATYPLNIKRKLNANIAAYLASKDQGLAAMWGAFTSVRFNCPTSKIVLGGYSQGAMVVHEFLNQFAKTHDPAGKSALIGAVVIADPERVKHSGAIEFGDAPPSSFGACDLVSVYTNCATPAPLADISGQFINRTVSDCLYDDPVCDTSDLARDLAINTRAGRTTLLNEAKQIHTQEYQLLSPTKTAGRWLGLRILHKA